MILNQNQLESLPFSLGIIDTLESIECKGNKINSFGSFKNNSLNRYPVLKYLDFSGNKFT